MATVLAGGPSECLAGSDTLVFAPGAVAPAGVRIPHAAAGSDQRSNPARDTTDRELYCAHHHVFWARPVDSWTELASQSHWWKPAAESFTVTFTTGHLIVDRPTVTGVEGTDPSAWKVACEPAMLAEPVGQHRIKRIFVTKPTGFMWDQSDIHIVADDDGRDLAITVAGVEALTARRLAGRFAAAAAQRRLQEREFIEEHDAEWLEAVAFERGAALELDWAWLYELPAHH